MKIYLYKQTYHLNKHDLFKVVYALEDSLYFYSTYVDAERILKHQEEFLLVNFTKTYSELQALEILWDTERVKIELIKESDNFGDILKELEQYYLLEELSR